MFRISNFIIVLNILPDFDVYPANKIVVALLIRKLTITFHLSYLISVFLSPGLPPYHVETISLATPILAIT